MAFGNTIPWLRDDPSAVDIGVAYIFGYAFVTASFMWMLAPSIHGWCATSSPSRLDQTKGYEATRWCALWKGEWPSSFITVDRHNAITYRCAVYTPLCFLYSHAGST